MKPTTMLQMTALAAVMATTGCLHTKQQADAFPPANRAKPVVIDPVGNPGPVGPIRDRNDAAEVVAFARQLSNAGRHAEAAEVYVDAAERFDSVGNRLEKDCRKAAVREYWLSGDLDAAHSLLATMESEQDLYARAAERDSLRRLRQLLNSTGEIVN